MKFLKFLPGILLIIFIGVGIYFLSIFLAKKNTSLKELQNITWAELATLDIESGFIPPQIKELEDQTIKMAGFVVPLTDDFKEIKEFLLVPDAMACIHVPPPPPNQMVVVHLKKSMNPQLAYGPVWIRGKLRVENFQSEFGVVSYQFDADYVRVYEEERW